MFYPEPFSSYFSSFIPPSPPQQGSGAQHHRRPTPLLTPSAPARCSRPTR
uniref:Uncharacterized protein n=1 Tax=Arundo donax TaxID=35708 RepID=A0A0A9HNW5_ARUDO